VTYDGWRKAGEYSLISTTDMWTFALKNLKFVIRVILLNRTNDIKFHSKAFLRIFVSFKKSVKLSK
jgi:hypothetical protein